MGFDQGFGYARQGLDGVLRAISADIGGDRDKRDPQQNNQTDTFQIVAVGDEGKHKQTAAHDSADGRKMVQQKMEVSQVHGNSVKDPRWMSAGRSTTISPAFLGVRASVTTLGTGHH